MVIFVLMSTAVVVAMSPALSDARLRSGSRMIVSVLNYARSFAIAHQTPTRVSLDRVENGFVVEAVMNDEKGEKRLTPLTTSAGKYKRLPAGLQIAEVRKLGTEEQEDFVGFLETGQAEHASVTITDAKGRQRRITVNGITGRCVIESDEDADPKADTGDTK